MTFRKLEQRQPPPPTPSLRSRFLNYLRMLCSPSTETSSNPPPHKPKKTPRMTLSLEPTLLKLSRKNLPEEQFFSNNPLSDSLQNYICTRLTSYTMVLFDGQFTQQNISTLPSTLIIARLPETIHHNYTSDPKTLTPATAYCARTRLKLQLSSDIILIEQHQDICTFLSTKTKRITFDAIVQQLWLRSETKTHLQLQASSSSHKPLEVSASFNTNCLTVQYCLSQIIHTIETLELDTYIFICPALFTAGDLNGLINKFRIKYFWEVEKIMEIDQVICTIVYVSNSLKVLKIDDKALAAWIVKQINEECGKIVKGNSNNHQMEVVMFNDQQYINQNKEIKETELGSLINKDKQDKVIIIDESKLEDRGEHAESLEVLNCTLLSMFHNLIVAGFHIPTINCLETLLNPTYKSDQEPNPTLTIYSALLTQTIKFNKLMRINCPQSKPLLLAFEELSSNASEVNPGQHTPLFIDSQPPAVPPLNSQLSFGCIGNPFHNGDSLRSETSSYYSSREHKDEDGKDLKMRMILSASFGMEGKQKEIDDGKEIGKREKVEKKLSESEMVMCEDNNQLPDPCELLRKESSTVSVSYSKPSELQLVSIVEDNHIESVNKYTNELN